MSLVPFFLFRYIEMCSTLLKYPWPLLHQDEFIIKSRKVLYIALGFRYKEKFDSIEFYKHVCKIYIDKYIYFCIKNDMIKVKKRYDFLSRNRKSMLLAIMQMTS